MIPGEIGTKLTKLTDNLGIHLSPCYSGNRLKKQTTTTTTHTPTQPYTHKGRSSGTLECYPGYELFFFLLGLYRQRFLCRKSVALGEFVPTGSTRDHCVPHHHSFFHPATYGKDSLVIDLQQLSRQDNKHRRESSQCAVFLLSSTFCCYNTFFFSLLPFNCASHWVLLLLLSLFDCVSTARME